MILRMLWFAFGISGAMIANKKSNRGFVRFVIGILLGPVGLLTAFFSSDNENLKRERTGSKKKCLYCEEYVEQDVLICKQCEIFEWRHGI